MAETCITCTVCEARALSLERLQEMPELDGRKFTEALLNIPLRPLQEDPGGAPVALAAQEVEATAHRSGADFCVGLHFHVHLPALLPALQLAQVLDAFLPWEGGAHGAVSLLTSHRVRCPRDSCQLDSGSPYALSRLRDGARRAGQSL